MEKARYKFFNSVKKSLKLIFYSQNREKCFFTTFSICLFLYTAIETERPVDLYTLGPLQIVITLIA